MTPSEAKTIYQDLEDHATFCRECLTIRDKHGAEQPLILQPAQLKLNKLIKDIRRRGKPVRIIALKARQVMVSTAVASEFFRTVPFESGQKAVIVAHELEACSNIFSYYQQFHDSYKPFRGFLHRAIGKVRSAIGQNRITYANKSSFKVLTAKNLKGGRSGSYRYLHLSEYAFWPNARKLMTGLMQCVPNDADTMVIIESTANGAGGDFHARWIEAMDPSGESEWVPYFFAWHEHPEYVRPLLDRAEFQASLTGEEKEIQTRYRLTLEQLHWRRWCIKSNCNGSIDTFRQEFPSHPEEAFIFSGRPRFSHTHLARMPRTEDGLVGELVEEHTGPRKLLLFQISEDGKGPLTIYKKPAPNKRYSIGADTATGIDVSEGDGQGDPDYSVACVLDVDTGEQVARLRGRMEPSPFAEYLAALGRHYNWAYLVPEANNCGLAVIEALLRFEYPPSLIYHRRRQPDELFSNSNSTKLQLLGFLTNTVTRVQIISNLDNAIRELAIAVRDPLTLAELRAFVVKASGKAEAQDGSHDDEVFALALALEGIQTAPAARLLANIDGQAVKPPTANQSGVKRYGQARRSEDRGVLHRF